MMKQLYLQGISILFFIMTITKPGIAIIGQVRFFTTLTPLLHIMVADHHGTTANCPELISLAVDKLPAYQEVLIALALSNIGCMDSANSIVRTLNAQKEQNGRSEFAAFQIGLIQWRTGNIQETIAHWQHVPDIQQWLYRQADKVIISDPNQAAQLYEIAILTAKSFPAFAETIVTYVEKLRGRMAVPILIQRIRDLESKFPSGSSVRFRLEGIRQQMMGDYASSYRDLLEASQSGFDDAETWYLMGDAARGLGNLGQAEQAYRRALRAPIQISWRRAWHLYRLADLLAVSGRQDESLIFLEEAVQISNYYYYSDALAVILREMGETERAQQMCARARKSAGQDRAILRCEQ